MIEADVDVKKIHDYFICSILVSLKNTTMRDRRLLVLSTNRSSKSR
jgi:hypothetical protein